ncbi:MAG: hypothetical protein M0Z65_05030 [Firmicutes bacterium]|nr:hypothetical protein [Bacillota bacterium]
MIKRLRNLPRWARTLLLLVVCLVIPLSVVAERYNTYSNHNHPITGGYGDNVSEEQREELDQAKENQEKNAHTQDAQTPSDFLVKFQNDRIKQVEEETSYDVKYNEYLPSRYTLELIYNDSNWWELDEKVSNTGHFFSNSTVNAIWMELVHMGFSVVGFTIDVFELDVVDRFADEIGTGIRDYAGFDGNGNMEEDGLWGSLLTGIIFMTGAWAVFFGMMFRKTIKMWQGLVGAIAVMVLFIGFYLNVGGVLNTLNAGSKDLSLRILKASQELMDDKEMPVEAYPYILGDHIYHMLIYTPYVVQQHNGIPEPSVELPDEPVYGDLPARQQQVFRDEIERAEEQRKRAQELQNEGLVSHERIQKILEHPLGSEARNNAVEDERDEYNNILVTTKGAPERLKSLPWLAILLLLQSVIFFLINLGVQVFQILFMLLTLLAPIIGILSIFPPLQQMARKWFTLWIMSLVTKIMFTVILSLLFFLSNLFYELVPPDQEGLQATLVWQIVILLAVIVFRKQIFGIFLKPSMQVQVRVVQSAYHGAKSVVQRQLRKRGYRGRGYRGRGYRGRNRRPAKGDAA